MESEYQGFFVGPAQSAEAMAAATESAAVGPEAIIGVPPLWAAVQLHDQALALASALGDGAWVWEVELRNDFAEPGDGDESERGESHSGTVSGSQWSAASRELHPRVHDELREEGFIRGGVMAEAAFEYVRWYARVEAESAAGPAAGPDPSTPIAPSPRKGPKTLADFEVDALLKIATALIDHLLETGDLEIVNHHGRTTLVAPLEACMSASANPAEAARRIALALEDASEVVEIYASEDELEAFIARAIAD